MKLDVQPWNEEFGCIVRSSDKNILKIDHKQVREYLAKYGMVLFRGFDLDLEKFKEFTNSFSQDHVVHYNTKLRKRVTDDGTVTEVSSGDKNLSLHGELFARPDRPAVIWLYCIQPSAIGGETIFCDGISLMKAMRPEIREMFLSKKLRYIRTIERADWSVTFDTQDINVAIEALKETGLDVVKKVDENVIEMQYVISALPQTKYCKERAFINHLFLQADYKHMYSHKVCFEDLSEIPESIIEELREQAEGYTRPLIWRPNDVAVADNSRVLHGRRAFHGPRKIVTRFSM